MGESAKDLELCQRAVQLRPNDPEAHHHLAWRYLQRGFYESGIAENRLRSRKTLMDSYFYNGQVRITFLLDAGKPAYVYSS
jgi:hypothetical protein